MLTSPLNGSFLKHTSKTCLSGQKILKLLMQITASKPFIFIKDHTRIQKEGEIGGRGGRRQEGGVKLCKMQGFHCCKGFTLLISQFIQTLSHKIKKRKRSRNKLPIISVYARLKAVRIILSYYIILSFNEFNILDK